MAKLAKSDAHTLALFPADTVSPGRSARELPIELPIELPAGQPRPRSLPRPASVLQPPPESSRAQQKRGQLWIAIHLSRLALDCLHIAEQAKPLAIIDAEDRVQTVLACNPAARAAGVRPGQSLNAALALESTLETRPRDPVSEQLLLEKVAAWCHRFTPLVSLEPPDELLLEVRGSLRLFGGARSLMESVAGGLRARGIEAALALTPTPRSALWLARARAVGRAGDSQPDAGPLVERIVGIARHLQPLPLPVLRWPGEIVQRLVSMGVRTTGDLLRLPRAGLTRRIGPQCMIELDQALGRHAEVRRRFRAAERFDERVSLDCELEAIDRVTQILQPMLRRLQRFLREREAAVATLVLRLEHRAGPPTLVRLGLAAPGSDVDHLHSLLREKLSRIELHAPVIALRLRSGDLLASVAANADLPCVWPRQTADEREREPLPAPMAHARPRLIERLQARLGRAGVFGIATLDDHRPEYAWRAIQPEHENRSQGQGNHGNARRCARRGARPLWLLPDPEPIAPQSGAARCDERGWRIESGPERIESGWWDGNDVMRDYFVALSPQGVRSWIYRERRAPHRWYLHGLFG